MFVNQQNFSPFLNIFIIAKFDELLHFGVYVVQIIGNILFNNEEGEVAEFLDNMIVKVFKRNEDEQLAKLQKVVYILQGKKSRKINII